MSKHIAIIPIWRLWFLICLSACCLGSAKGAADSSTFFPLNPADLLALLPKAPENWKMTASVGEKRLSFGGVPEAYATRSFLYVPPPPPAGSPPTPPAPPETIKITLLDSGNNDEHATSFDGFVAEKDPAASSTSKYHNILVENLPATQFQNGVMTIVSVGVSKRFLLNLQMMNLNPAHRDEWLKIVAPAKLAEASARAPQAPLVSGMVTMESIDELKPETNTKAQINVVLHPDLDRANVAK